MINIKKLFLIDKENIDLTIFFSNSNTKINIKYACFMAERIINKIINSSL